jgi:hypothetical protein
MLRVLAEVLSERERAYAPGGAEHVVAMCMDSVPPALGAAEFSSPLWKGMFHVKHQAIG